MFILIWADSRFVYLYYPALWLTVSLVSIHGNAFIFYAALVLSSAIQWAATPFGSVPSTLIGHPHL